MDGLFVNGRRPKSKAEVRKALAADPRSVVVERTSHFGGGYSGPAADMPESAIVYFVFPCPYTARKAYGTLSKSGGKLRVA
jgi:hypothetical protein